MRILIAGLGAIGQRHARNLRSLLGDRLELLAYRRRRLRHVVTDTLERDDTRDVEREFGVTTYLDLDAALAARPDAVFVCTPSSEHLVVARAAAAAGTHLFVEKPLSHSLDGVEELRCAVAGQGLIAMVGCQWRFHTGVAWLRDVLRDGALGTLRSVSIDYAEYLPDWHPYEDYRASYAARADLGGGVVLTQIHDYDLAWWLFGPVRSVNATGGHLSALEIDVEDTVDARLECEDATVRVRQTFAARPPRRTLSVEAEHGSVVLDLLAGTVTSALPRHVPEPPAPRPRNEMFIAEAAHFLGCVQRRERPLVPIDEGIAVLRVALAVKESIATGRQVNLS